MKPLPLFALVPAYLLAVSLQAADFDIQDEAEFRKCVPSEATLTQLATGMGFTEGPVWLARDGGFLVFSDIPGDELKKWTAAGGLVSYRKPSRNTNGNATDGKALFSCEHTGRRVAVEVNGELQTLVDKFEDKKLNSPNDAAAKSDGTLWFTDPDYGLPNKPGTKEKDGKEQPGNYVYRYDLKAKKLTAVAKDFDKPNGIAFSPDEKKLYVADSGAPKHIRVFDVKADGTLANGKVFCTLDKGVPDGIRVDAAGRVWSSAGDGVQIFSPSGKLVGRILVAESPANLCFGGTDGKTLFITARKSLYSIETAVKGAH